VQHFDLVKGKNATDMAMLIDAMDLLYTGNHGISRSPHAEFESTSGAWNLLIVRD
jgi:hypothetical protein